MNTEIVRLSKHEMVVDKDHYEEVIAELNEFRANVLVGFMQKGILKRTPETLARIAILQGLPELADKLIAMKESDDNTL